MWDWLAPVAGAVLGATQSDKGGQVTQSNSIDPRIANILYGSSGTGGLLDDAQSIYYQQMQQGGLNDMQRQGLNMQAQYLQSPQYQNSYQSMMNQGMGLLGAGIAGNPFTRSQGGQQSQPMGQGGLQYSQAPTQIQTIRPQVQAPAQQTAPQGSQPSMVNTESSIGNMSGMGGGPASNSGQGINNDVAKAALAAMAAAENPALRAFAPSLAALLGVGGYAVAGQQADAMGAAGDKLSASQPLANLGIGTVSDMNGNVRTFSNPASIAAADRAMFSTGTDGYGGGYSPGFGSLGNSSFGEGEY